MPTKDVIDYKLRALFKKQSEMHEDVKELSEVMRNMHGDLITNNIETKHLKSRMDRAEQGLIGAILLIVSGFITAIFNFLGGK